MESEGVIPLNNKVFDPEMKNHSIDFYHFPASFPSRAALLLVRALGLKHNVKIVNLMQGEQMSPQFLKLNPTHTVPTIDDNGFVLWDSHVIMKYLVDQYAKDDSLYPKDAKRGALVNQRLFFNAGYLALRFTNFIRPIIFKHESPDEEKAGEFEEALKILDGFLNNQVWVAGQYMSIADFAMITVISSAEATDYFDIKKYTNIWSWYQRTKSAMSGFGYEEVVQAGSNVFGEAFKNSIK